MATGLVFVADAVFNSGLCSELETKAEHSYVDGVQATREDEPLSGYRNLPAPSGGSGLNSYLAAIRKFPLLEKEEEYMLAKRWVEHQDSEAAHDLVTSHLRLAAKIAMGYRGYGLPISDVISEANVGLMQAVKKFDPERGFRLATYAIWWIRASVQEFILRSWSIVKMGTTRSQKKLFFNLRKAKQRIGVLDNNELTDEQANDLSEMLNVTQDEVRSMNGRLSGRDGSLNVTIGSDEDDSREWLDTIADESANHAEVYAETQEKEQRSKLLHQALDVLNEREADILSNRKLSDTPKTLEELSVKYSVSRERIRQIEEKAFEKIKGRVLELAREQRMVPAAA